MFIYLCFSRTFQKFRSKPWNERSDWMLTNRLLTWKQQQIFPQRQHFSQLWRTVLLYQKCVFWMLEKQTAEVRSITSCVVASCDKYRRGDRQINRVNKGNTTWSIYKYTHIFYGYYAQIAAHELTECWSRGPQTHQWTVSAFIWSHTSAQPETWLTSVPSGGRINTNTVC